MSLSDLAGQDRVRSTAATWLESGRVPHAILICGAEGVGKRRFALELAKALLCAPEDDRLRDLVRGKSSVRTNTCPTLQH